MYIREPYNEAMKRIGELMNEGGERSRKRITERGEMMRYFMEKLNVSRKQDGLPPLTMARMGRVLQAIPTRDLYYLKSVCEQATNFSKKFWWEVNPKKHTDTEGTNTINTSKKARSRKPKK